jgi:uncharacterized protein (DUF697 family)
MGWRSRIVRVAGERLGRFKNELDQVAATRLGWLSGADEGRDCGEEPSGGDPELEACRCAARKVIDEYAGLTVANAFNPIPLLDLSLDVGLLMAMSRAIAVAYGLDEEHQERLSRLPATSQLARKALHQVALSVPPRVATRVLAVALPWVGLEFVARQTSKWVPLAGSLVAARIGYRIAWDVGGKVMADCEAVLGLSATDCVEFEKAALPGESGHSCN